MSLHACEVGAHGAGHHRVDRNAVNTSATTTKPMTTPRTTRAQPAVPVLRIALGNKRLRIIRGPKCLRWQR